MKNFTHKNLACFALSATIVFSPMSASLAALPSFVVKVQKTLGLKTKKQEIQKEIKTPATQNQVALLKPYLPKIEFAVVKDNKFVLQQPQNLQFKSQFSHEVEALDRKLNKKVNLVKSLSNNSKIDFRMQTSKNMASLEFEGAVNAHLDYKINDQDLSLNLKWNW